MSIQLQISNNVSKSGDMFSRRVAIKSIGVGSFIFAIFAVGFLFGNATGNHSFASDSLVLSQSIPVEGQLLTKVKGVIDEKFVFWKSSATLPTPKEIEYGVVGGYVNSFKDPYTVFFPPKEAKAFTENVKGSFGGVGMNVGMKDGNIVVIAPLKDSPAMKAGIKAGDIIAAVDGKSVLGQSSDEAVSLIRGELDTPVKITVLHQGARTTTDITIIRKEIKIPTLDTEKKDGVFIIHLYNFSAESPELFKNAINEFSLSKLKYLVIYVRGNPGVYLDAVQMSSYFLDSGKIVVSEKHGKQEEVINHRSSGLKGLPSGINVAVMVDGGSASASEILAGALKDHGIAKVVGKKSFGKGSVQELVNFDDGSSLKVTIAKWYTPAGVNISESGIKPDVEVEVATTTPKGYKGVYDSQLIKAIQVVKAK